MEKNKKLIVLGVLALILIISGITYAILTWTSSRVNIGLTSNCFTIDYTKGNDIANASIKALNESDLISDNKFTIKEGIALTYANIGIKSTCTIEGYGSLYLNVATLSSAFSTGNSKGALKYAVLDNTSTTSTVTVASLLNQKFNIVSKGSITNTGKITLLTKQLSNTKLNKYLIVIYADVSKIANDAMDASFNGTVSADANQGKIDANYTLQRLNSLNNTIKVDTSKTPDFSTVSGNNGVKKSIDDDSTIASNQGDGTKGIYASEDDFGTSYYFRGAVENNYVKFANYYWRVIRINGDGSVRMIYAGTSAHANGEEETDSHIGLSEYNTNYQDNGYVGYMYGNFTTPTNCNTDESTGVTTCTGGSTSYNEAHANINNSTIKTYIDNWYNTNLSNYSYAIEDTIYCNDRSITPVDSFMGMTLTGTGKAMESTAYSGLTRGYISHNPTLKCTNKNDRFTVNNNIGNTKLTNPVGLITLDEIMMGGLGRIDLLNLTSYIINLDSYLTTPDFSYWTMTPFMTADDANANVYAVDRNMLAEGGYVGYDACDVRPVISLRSDAISGGSGTMTDPFTVG